MKKELPETVYLYAHQEARGAPVMLLPVESPDQAVQPGRMIAVGEYALIAVHYVKSVTQVEKRSP